MSFKKKLRLDEKDRTKAKKIPNVKKGFAKAVKA